MIKALATYKVRESVHFRTLSDLKCDICDSNHILETKEGYVCRECGLVLEFKRLQYDRPYNEENIQYARGISTTQIGTKRERTISPNSTRLQRLNRYNSIKDNEKAVFEKVRIEISRIFNALDLAGYDSVKEMVLTKFKQIRPKLDPGTKFRSPEKLVATIAHFCLKLRNIAVNSADLVEISKITKKEFNVFILQIQRFFPRYAKREYRKKYILQRVYEISEHFKLGTDFYKLGKRILNRLWDGVKNTTDNALAALISSISLICLGNTKVSVSAICSRLGVRMSTIQSQVKKRIFDQFHINGFVSLIRSSDLLIKIMKKLGLLENEHSTEDSLDEAESEELVELVMGNTTEIFNRHNILEYYYFALQDKNKCPVAITLNSPKKVKKGNLLKLALNLKIRKTGKWKNQSPEFEILRYHGSKGPPLANP